MGEANNRADKDVQEAANAKMQALNSDLDNTIASEVQDKKNQQLAKDAAERKDVEAKANLIKAKRSENALKAKKAGAATGPAAADGGAKRTLNGKAALQEVLATGPAGATGGLSFEDVQKLKKDKQLKGIDLVANETDKDQMQDALSREMEQLAASQHEAEVQQAAAEKVNLDAVAAEQTVQAKSRELAAMSGLNISGIPEAARVAGATGGATGGGAAAQAPKGATGIAAELEKQLAGGNKDGEAAKLDQEAARVAAKTLAEAGAGPEAAKAKGQTEAEKMAAETAAELRKIQKENEALKADNVALKKLQSEAKAVAAGNAKALNETQKLDKLATMEKMLGAGPTGGAAAEAPAATGGAARGGLRGGATGATGAAGAQQQKAAAATGPEVPPKRTKSGQVKLPTSTDGKSLVFPSAMEGPTGGATGGMGNVETQAKRLQQLVSGVIAPGAPAAATGAATGGADSGKVSKDVHETVKSENSALKSENEQLKKALTAEKVKVKETESQSAEAKAAAAEAKAAAYEKDLAAAQKSTATATDGIQAATDSVVNRVDATFSSSAQRFKEKAWDAKSW